MTVGSMSVGVASTSAVRRRRGRRAVATTGMLLVAVVLLSIGTGPVGVPDSKTAIDVPSADRTVSWLTD